MPRLVKIGSLLLLSALLFGIGVWIAGPRSILENLQQFSFGTVAAVFIAFVLNFAVVTLRLSVLLKFFHIKLPYSIAFKASLQGHFASLFFISLFGQVAGRQAVLRHFGTSPVFIASLTAIERFMLFIVSGFFCLLGVSWLIDGQEFTGFISKTSLSEIIFVIVVSFIVSLCFGRSKFERRLLIGIRSRKSIIQFFKIGFITILAQVLILGAFVLGVMRLAPEVGFISLLAAAAITSFAASLPISVNGWGIREVTAIFAFGHVGVEPAAALAVSILIGLCSTAAVVILWPYVFKKEQDVICSIAPLDQSINRLPIEKIATWGLITASAIFIFFQIHIPLHGGLINFNLADPFALLAFAAVSTHSFYSKQLPRWRIPKFNILILITGLVIFLAFLNGLQIIGVTQWALASRLFGWLILLGYLSIGVLILSYLGKLGVRRFMEYMIVTVVIVILFHAFSRWLAFSGWVDSTNLPLNFQGFSGNRNAFAFQLLTCSVLWLAYAGKVKEGREKIFYSLGKTRDFFLPAFHGVILAGLVFSGSRAGVLTGTILILGAWLGGFVDRKVLLRSMIFGLIVWLVFAMVLPSISQALVSGEMLAGQIHAPFAVQSIVSNEVSNLERWETIRRGLLMWLDSPWLGAGLGVFIETSIQWFRQPIMIHSTPVWLLAEFGIIGSGFLLSGFGWLIFSTKKSGFKRCGNRAVVMLLGIFLLFGLVHEIFYQRIFWLILGICLALPFDRYSRKISL